MRFWLGLAAAAAVVSITGCGGGGGSSPPPVITVSVNPQAVTLRSGDSQRFFATISGAANPSVTWLINGKPGGDTTVGIIDSSGNYTAPTPAPLQNNVQITATSVADASKSGSTQATLLNSIALLYLLSPATLIPNAPFTLNVTGGKFVTGAQVMFGSAPVATNFIDPSHLSASGTAPAAASSTLRLSIRLLMAPLPPPESWPSVV